MLTMFYLSLLAAGLALFCGYRLWKSQKVMEQASKKFNAAIEEARVRRDFALTKGVNLQAATGLENRDLIKAHKNYLKEIPNTWPWDGSIWP